MSMFSNTSEEIDVIQEYTESGNECVILIQTRNYNNHIYCPVCACDSQIHSTGESNYICQNCGTTFIFKIKNKK